MDNAHALVVGIAAYESTPPSPLPPTVIKDAQDVADLLLDPDHCGYRPENVRVLLDEQATREALVKELEELAARATADSTALIYVSAHGGRLEQGPQAGEYLLPVDVRLDPPEAMAETAISGDELTARLAAIPARRVLVLFDCCHAGGIGTPKGATAPTLKAGLSESYYEALQAGRGRVIVASCREDESSYVMPGDANSLFTRHLLDGLRGGVPSEDGLVRVFHVYDYLQPRVTVDGGQRQHPVFSSKMEENFPIALWRGGAKGAVPKDADGFRWDAYISYVDREPDTTYVWDTLVPRLQDAGLNVAVSGDVERGGVERVVSKEEAIKQAKRTVVALSPAYAADRGYAEFENTLAQSIGIRERSYRLLPVVIQPLEDGELQDRLSMLVSFDLVHPRRAERNFERLVEELRAPLPTVQ